MKTPQVPPLPGMTILGFKPSTKPTKLEPPAHYADQDGHYDCTGHIGQLGTNNVLGEPHEWPMYSFDRAAYALWNALAAELHAAGWTDDEIKDWLQSKSARWALDGELEDKLAKVGKAYARQILKGRG